MRALFTSIILLLSFPAFGDQIHIGMSAPFTGPTKNLGEELKMGAEAFFNSYNNTQAKHTIKLVPLDDGYEPDRMVKNTQLLLSQKVFALFSYVGTPTTSSTLPIIKRTQSILFAPFTGAEFLRTPFKRNIFNIRASYYLEAETQVQYFVDLMKHKKVALFIQADEFGLEASKGFINALDKRNITPIDVVRYKRNTENIDQATEKLRQLNVDVIFCVATYSPVALMVEKLRAAGIKSKVSTLSFSGAESLKNNLNNYNDIYISSVMPNPLSSDLTLVKEYREAMGNNNLSHETLEGYVNALFFTKVLDTFDNTPSTEEFIRRAETMKFSHGGIAFSFSANNRQGLNYAYLNQIKKDGLFQVIKVATF